MMQPSSGTENKVQKQMREGVQTSKNRKSKMHSHIPPEWNPNAWNDVERDLKTNLKCKVVDLETHCMIQNQGMKAHNNKLAKHDNIGLAPIYVPGNSTKAGVTNMKEQKML